MAALYGQAFAAGEGKSLVENIGNTGETFNKFTGAGGVASPGLRALFGDVQGANITRDRAAAAASYASAGERNAQTRKINQDLDQGQRTGNLQVVTGPDGTVTIVDKVNRTAQPVLGADGKPVVKGAAGGGGKPMTEGQAKANIYGGRMLESDKILSEMDIANDRLPQGGRAATNWTQSPHQQQVDQARRDFINAVLRRESGAAISPSEFANADKQYFPQLGDSKEVLAQKRRNRQVATTLMLQEVPEAQRYRLGMVPKPGPTSRQGAGGASGSWDTPTAPSGWSIQRVN